LGRVNFVARLEGIISSTATLSISIRWSLVAAYGGFSCRQPITKKAAPRIAPNRADPKKIKFKCLRNLGTNERSCNSEQNVKVSVVRC
jgi:hypothetical protein